MTSPATPPAQYLGFRGDRRKTWLMLLAGHAAHADEAKTAGLDCSQTPVLYVDAENGERIMAERCFWDSCG